MKNNLRAVLLVMFAASVSFVCRAIVSSDSARTPQQQYIQKYSALAIEEMNRSGVPASITLAQGLLESRYGLSDLAVEGNNHFGIKCHNNWNGGKMYHDDDRRGECFRKYDSPEESFRDHSDFLRYRDRYRFLFDLDPTDYRGWAHGLKKAGYATDSSYPQKLIRLIEEYELHKYDVKVEPELLPQTPSRIEQPKPLTERQAETFRFTLSRKMYSLNGVPFIYAVEGETYSDIAQRYNLFLREILNYNDLDQEETLHPGTVVYLQKKKKEAVYGMDKYIVDGVDVTLRDIAQRFAVRLSKLCRMNGFEEDHKPKDGEVIVLRKN